MEGDFRHEIRILAFKPNEFKVAAEPDKAVLRARRHRRRSSTQGDYLFGAPMAGATVTTTVSRQEVPFTPPGMDGFTVTDDVFTGDYPDDTKAAEQIDSQDGSLDDKGTFKRSVPLAFDDQRRPERVVFDTEVQDLSRDTVSARSSVMVHPGEFYVALRAPKDRFVAAGTALKTEVAAVDPNGARRPNVKVKVELVERRWNGVTGEQPDGKATRSSKPQDTVVASCDAVTTRGGLGLRSARRARRVLHRARHRERSARQHRAREHVDLRHRGQPAGADGLGRRRSPRDQARGEQEDATRSATAPRSSSRNPFKEAQALVTVERNGVLWRQVVPIKGSVPVIDIPIRPEFYPNAFVSVVALRGRIQAAAGLGRRPRRPRVPLRLDRAPRQRGGASPERDRHRAEGRVPARQHGRGRRRREGSRRQARRERAHVLRRRRGRARAHELRDARPAPRVREAPQAARLHVRQPRRPRAHRADEGGRASLAARLRVRARAQPRRLVRQGRRRRRRRRSSAPTSARPRSSRRAARPTRRARPTSRSSSPTT